MPKTTRRTFIASAAAVTASAATFGITPMDTEKEKTPLTHHVFFWLKNPGSTTDRDNLVQGVKGLAKIETVKKLIVGVPASTEQRDVVDASYAVSELMFFDSVEGQNVYQDHPLHKKFIEEHAHLWDKVVVYDTLEV
ncbi:MAG: Dabb family protein [Bacteroidia bacterium]|nr:Dabb family protein [Bacteroidia bacterium]